MKKKIVKIPKFKSDAEAARFFDTHDSTEFLSQTQPARLTFPKPGHKVVIDLNEKAWFILLRMAGAKRIPYSSLLETFVKEKLLRNR